MHRDLHGEENQGVATADAPLFLDVIVPVHNEERSIESVLVELSSQLLAHNVPSYRLIVCEDGSTDKTLMLVRRLAEQIPIEVVTAPTRKGHGRAVLDGMRASTAELCAVIEGDGQTDPASVTELLNKLDDFDVCVGCRSPRSDNVLRKMLSRGFRAIYRALLQVELRDPSYACVVIRRNALDRVLKRLTNLLNEGVFWEFHAWGRALHLRAVEVPVHHRPRVDGTTRVFRVWRLPVITWHNVAGLLTLRRQIRDHARAARIGDDRTVGVCPADGLADASKNYFGAIDATIFSKRGSPHSRSQKRSSFSEP